MIPYIILMIIGNVVVGVGYQQHWDWKVRLNPRLPIILNNTNGYQIIVIIGYTCLGIQVAALPAISSAYAIDSYKPVAGALFLNITINKNVWGYGFSKFITPWSMKSGFVPPILTNMALNAFFCMTGVIFLYYGKTFRKWTRNSKVHAA
jgi:hypothetical protein